MLIRKANINDFDLLLQNRMEFLISVTNKQYSDDFINETKSYIQSHLADNSLICYLVTDGNKILSSAVLCVYDCLPTPSNPSTKNGYLQNVYTIQSHRRQGLSTLVLNEIIKEAKSIGIVKILLDYTNDGLKLYEKLGFKHLDREMELKL